MTDSAREERGFSSVTLTEWRARVEEELGSLDFDDALVTELDGVGRIEPLYTAESVGSSGSHAAPGEAPFVRGTSASGNEWVNCPIYSRWSPEEVRARILADLRGGTDGVHLRFDRAVRRGALQAGDVGQDGIVLYRLDDLRNALDGVHLEMIQLLRLEAGGRATEAAALLMAILRERRLDLSALRISFGLDPLGTLATDGALPREVSAYGAEMAALCRRLEVEMPHGRVLAVSSRGYHNAGADPALELACVIGAWVEYLRMLGAEGVPPAQAARQTELSIAVGKDLFVEIAKLRALRGLWSRVLEAVGVAKPVPPFVHAFSSERSLSVRDPSVNMLRVTSHALAAAIGGADVVSTGAFDSSSRDPSDLGRRVARNTQLILAGESGLTDVVDPAGGSYYVESLTRQLAVAAWERLQEIERAGGLTRALVDGEIGRRIGASSRRRHERLAQREPAITGVSAFPNRTERALDVPPSLPADEARAIAEVGRAGEVPESLDLDSLVDLAAAGDSVFELGGQSGGVEIDVLPTSTDAAPFEALRTRGERLRQPAVFLANVGRLREHKPRASFAREAFGVAGLDVDSGPGTDGGDAEAVARELVEQFRTSDARALCVCGTDEQYESVGIPIVRALAEAGATPIWMSGRPRSDAALKSAGVAAFLAAGGDLLALLGELLTHLEAHFEALLEGGA